MIISGILLAATLTAGPAATNQFAEAQQLFTAKCASCHAHKIEPIKPAKFTAAKLTMWMEKMAPISKFTPVQTAMVGNYLEAVRAGQAALPVGDGNRQPLNHDGNAADKNGKK